MTEKIKSILEDIRSKEYRKSRAGRKGYYDDIKNVDKYMKNLRKNFDDDFPYLYPNDDFGFNRMVDGIIENAAAGGNVIPNYGKIITEGFDDVAEKITTAMKNTNDPQKLENGRKMLEFIDMCIKCAEGYRNLAKEKGNERLYNALCNIPRKGAESFYEALVFMKLCVYALRNAFVYHLCLGRFDVYMYPFYKSEVEKGACEESLLELIEEFFLSINRDTDLYVGVQQGDNGQSMVLGGVDIDGNSMYNGLSRLCLKASLELCVIEPKINLRVSKNTPDEIFEFATLLTKQALGFPQYCNDDVVIPGLIKLGYEPKDACNYAVAACWEYIIPDCGADIPNIDVMDFPAITARTVRAELEKSNTFDELLENVKSAIKQECDDIVASRPGDRFHPNLPLSVFFDGCAESLNDLWHGGGKYNNFGCHGTGIANAVDALSAIKKCVFEDNSVTKKELLSALEKDFEGYEAVRKLLKAAPKMGCNDDYADSIASEIMDAFTKNLNNRPNGKDGIWRAGTGSAMEYILKGRECPATADGRKNGEPYSSSFSPSLDVKPDGLLSVIQSFTKYDMTEIINGGPLTIEIHDSVLKNDLGIKKTAMLVKSFIKLGGHQLQLNSMNRETLLDAQQNPEKYPNLVVRVWGWSGYFNELDREYQNHIIRRLEYSL